MKQSIDKKLALTTHDAAKILYVTASTIITWVDTGKIKAIRTIGGHRRIPVSEIAKIKKELGFELLDNI